MSNTTLTGTTYVLVLENWHPTRPNQLLGGHWASGHRLKKADRQLIGMLARAADTSSATGKRRVSLRLTLAPRQRGADPDAYWKSVLDALVHAGLLLDDNRQGVELGEVSFTRGPSRKTEIVLEDMADVALRVRKRGNKRNERAAVTEQLDPAGSDFEDERFAAAAGTSVARPAEARIQWPLQSRTRRGVRTMSLWT